MVDSAFVYAWVILPLLIFSARVCDVSLGTIRVIFISKGIRLLAPLIGFFEVIIWLLAIGQVMNNIGNVASYIAYGAGFATGTYVGMMIEERLSIGTVILRVITNRDPAPLVRAIREKGFGLTVVDATGVSGPVNVLFMVIRRQDLGIATAVIRDHQPEAFFTVEEVRTAADRVYHPLQGRSGLHLFQSAGTFFRKER